MQLSLDFYFFSILLFPLKSTVQASSFSTTLQPSVPTTNLSFKKHHLLCHKIFVVELNAIEDKKTHTCIFKSWFLVKVQTNSRKWKFSKLNRCTILCNPTSHRNMNITCKIMNTDLVNTKSSKRKGCASFVIDKENLNNTQCLQVRTKSCNLNNDAQWTSITHTFHVLSFALEGKTKPKTGNSLAPNFLDEFTCLTSLSRIKLFPWGQALVRKSFMAATWSKNNKCLFVLCTLYCLQVKNLSKLC